MKPQELVNAFLQQPYAARLIALAPSVGYDFTEACREMQNLGIEVPAQDESAFYFYFAAQYA